MPKKGGSRRRPVASPNPTQRASSAPPLKTEAKGGVWLRPEILLMLLETCLTVVIFRLIVFKSHLVDTG